MGLRVFRDELTKRCDRLAILAFLPFAQLPARTARLNFSYRGGIPHYYTLPVLREAVRDEFVYADVGELLYRDRDKQSQRHV